MKNRFENKINKNKKKFETHIGMLVYAHFSMLVMVLWLKRDQWSFKHCCIINKMHILFIMKSKILLIIKFKTIDFFWQERKISLFPFLNIMKILLN